MSLPNTSFGSKARADVVALALAHLGAGAVGALDQAGGDDDLGLLPGVLHDPAAHLHVQQLVQAAQFDVCGDLDRVQGHDDGVDELGHGQAAPGREPAAEVLALQGGGDGQLLQHADELRQGDRGEPFAVVPEVGAGEVEERGHLVAVGGHIAADVVVGQRRPVGGPPGGVADLGSDIADDEDDLVPHPLEPAGDDHRHRVADVHVGGGRVDPELDDQLASLGTGCAQSRGQVAGGRQKLLGPGRDQRRLLGREQVGQVHRPAVAEQLEDLGEFGSFAQLRRVVQDGHERGVGGTEPGALGNHRGVLIQGRESSGPAGSFT